MDNSNQTTQTPQETEIIPVDDSGNAREITQKQTAFVPTPKMIKWLETGFKINSASPSAIAKELKQVNRTYYDWIDIAGFLDWWNDTWMKFYKAQQARLIDMGMENASKDHTWWRDMMEFFGLMQPVAENVPAPQTMIQVMGNALATGAKEREVTIPAEEIKEEPKP